MAKTTILEIDGVALGRWGMDHIGDTDLLQNWYFSWDKGGVTDENRENKNIENVEEQFERQMKTRYRNYMSASNGMQLQSNELIGDSGDFDTISVSVDLMGKQSGESSLHHLFNSTNIAKWTTNELLRSFTTTQTTPIWQDYASLSRLNLLF